MDILATPSRGIYITVNQKVKFKNQKMKGETMATIRKKVKYIRRDTYGDGSTTYLIILEDGVPLRASQDINSDLPWLGTGCIADPFPFPDAGFDKALGLEYIYQETYALIEPNGTSITLVFHKDADRQQFFAK